MTQVLGMKELERKLQRLAKFGRADAARLRAIDNRVAEVYNVALRANIKDSPVDIKVYRNGEVRQTIKRGTLRRSIKAFRRKNKNITFAGPKSSKSRTKTNRQNGWFASIVEGGKGFGPSRNMGLFERTQRSTKKRMQQLRLRLYRQEFERYMK